MSIRYLDPVLINQIAAGEVVDRPASVIKELVENSLDAGATHITITLREGGCTYMCVEDNGTGMDEADLKLCIERHATSKVPDHNLFNIKSLGFRGEALASVASIARVSITTRQACDPARTGRIIRVEGGQTSDIQPAVIMQSGTRVEVSDLFYAIPARLKFLKSASSELSACLRAVEQLSLAYPDIHFKVIHNDRIVRDTEDAATDLTQLEQRMYTVIAPDFLENALKVDYADDDMHISGYVSMSTYHASQSHKQFFLINQRPVRDKVLQNALRVAYGDVLPKGRYPLCYMRIKLPEMYVDMNVHPAKTEVRFLDQNKVKRAVIQCIKDVLTHHPVATSRHLSHALADTLTDNTRIHEPYRPQPHNSYTPPQTKSDGRPSESYYTNTPSEVPVLPFTKNETASHRDTLSHACSPLPLPNTMDHPLGHAVAQIFQSYILTQNDDTFFIVDQHAAAERILYEKLKNHMHEQGLESQRLLIPALETVEADVHEIIQAHDAALSKFGILLEPFGVNQIRLVCVPALLDIDDPQVLLRDLLHDLAVDHDASTLTEMILHRLSTHACHHSVRFGRKLSIDEMNALLRDIESTPHAMQCNHGRPVLISLHQKDFERLFERT